MNIQALLPRWVLQLIQHPRTALSDIPAGLMMAVLVIPQSLGYATLAGLPPIMGLYAAITPVIVYAWKAPVVSPPSVLWQLLPS